MSRSSWTHRINRQLRQWFPDWLHDLAANAEQLDTLDALLEQLAAEYLDLPPAADQVQAVEKQIDWLAHALNPDNSEQQERLNAARAGWQAILDAPEDRRLARIEADLEELKTAMEASHSEQATVLEKLTHIEQALAESEPHTAEQAERGSAIQRRLRDLLLAAGGAAGFALLGAAVQEEGVWPEIRQVVQSVVDGADTVQATERAPGAAPPPPRPAP